jgi:hypothetical protein
VLNSYPLPNQAGSGNGTVGNYFTNQLRPYDYNAALGRVDHNFTESNRLYVNGYWNKRRENRYNWAQDAPNATDDGIINGFAVTKGFDYRTNAGFTVGYTTTLAPTMLMDVKGSWARFGEWRDPADDFDPAALGFSAAALQAMGGYRYLPLFTFGSFSTTNANSTIASLGSQRSDWGPGFDRPIDTYSVQPTFTKIWGAHTARAGYDFRHQIWNVTSAGMLADVSVQWRVYTGDQLRRAERSRASVGSVPARAADGGDRRGCRARNAVQPIRNRLRWRVQPDAARAVPAG